MSIYRIAIVAISLLCLLAGVSGLTSEAEASTTFTKTTILAVDQTQRTLTFRTVEGQSWTLPVADPKILTKEQFSKGDQVSIELDLNDRISKIIKLSGRPQAEQTQSP
jgi:hypothetical protein